MFGDVFYDNGGLAQGIKGFEDDFKTKYVTIYGHPRWWFSRFKIVGESKGYSVGFTEDEVRITMHVEIYHEELWADVPGVTIRRDEDNKTGQNELTAAWRLYYDVMWS